MKIVSEETSLISWLKNIVVEEIDKSHLMAKENCFGGDKSSLMTNKKIVLEETSLISWLKTIVSVETSRVSWLNKNCLAKEICFGGEKSCLIPCEILFYKLEVF